MRVAERLRAARARAAGSGAGHRGQAARQREGSRARDLSLASQLTPERTPQMTATAGPPVDREAIEAEARRKLDDLERHLRPTGTSRPRSRPASIGSLFGSGR